MHKDIREKLERIKTALTEQITNKLTDEEHDISMDIIDSIPEELQTAFIIIYNKNKNMMVKQKSSQYLTMLMIVDIHIELVTHLEYLEIEQDKKEQNELIVNTIRQTQPLQNNNNTNTTLSWFTLANVFKFIFIFIMVVFTIWSMFILNPEASDKTFNVISNMSKIIKGKDE